MSALKMAVSLAARGAGAGGFSAVRAAGVPFTYNKHVSRKMPTSYLTLVSIQARFLSSQDITKNIQYISEEKGLNLERDPDTLKLVKPIDKPLCIMLNWMLAKQKHIHKYARLYLEQGYDVLSVTCTPWQLLWPMKGSQLVAADALRFLESNPSFNPLVIHSFSIGGYVFGELLLHASRNKPRFKLIIQPLCSTELVTPSYPANIHHLEQRSKALYIKAFQRSLSWQQFVGVNVCRAVCIGREGAGSPSQTCLFIVHFQLVAADLLRFMESNTLFNPLVVHGFSVGGYMWGEVCLLMSTNKSKYQPVLDRVAAQIWDSAADISEIQIGVPKAVFPKNIIMQNALRKYMVYHMKAFHESATIHYMRSSQQFHLNLCRAPALFLLSKSDPVGAEDSNRRVHDSWKSLGIKTTWKCWDKSSHVAHYKTHTSEYLTLMSEHLGGLDLLSQPEKIRARI